ncbi:MAG: nuclear transport factor 2 family protein, partial [Candidatus Acidiferrales bacterium]
QDCGCKNSARDSRKVMSVPTPVEVKKMGGTENKQLLQRIFEELSKGNSEPFVASMADDFRWTVTGTTKWSRTYEGKQSVLVELFGPLRARIDGRIRTTAHRLIAEGDYVVVEARGSNTTKRGATVQ